MNYLAIQLTNWGTGSGTFFIELSGNIKLTK